MGRAGRVKAHLRRRRDERGAALVEAAIVFPVLILLTFGAIELGLGFNQKGVLESASRSGARIASTDAQQPNVATDALGAVNTALKTGSAPDVTTLYVYDPSVPGAPGGCVTNCIQFNADATKKQFDPTPHGGGWPAATQLPCNSPPTQVAVRVVGQFTFLSNLIGTGNITLTSTSTLNFEPTIC